MKIKKRLPKQSAFARIDWEKAVSLFRESPKQEEEQGTYPSTKEILSFIAGVGAVGLILAFPPAITGVAALIRLGRRDYSGWGEGRNEYHRNVKRKTGKTRTDEIRLTSLLFRSVFFLDKRCYFLL